jgi:protein gp37
MADGTHIEWTDATWNPVTGCSVVSPGCTHCYAMRLAGTRLKDHPSRAGLTTPSKAGPVWNGQVRFNEAWLTQPLRWKAPRKIFVCAHGDLFHESIPDAWIDQVFAVMALAPQHTFQVLTKRAARMREMLTAVRRPGLPERVVAAITRLEIAGSVSTQMASDATRRPVIALPNVWLGVSVEDQVRADERIPELLATPAAKRFISAEPLLGPIDCAWALSPNRLEICAGFLKRGHFSPGLETLRPLDWVIAGGESGRGARPMHPDWARSIRDQCASASVPFFFKQWGEWRHGEVAIDERGHTHTRGPWGVTISTMPTDAHRSGFVWLGKHDAGAVLDGVEHRAFPASSPFPNP